jgi:hypothetical protein
MMTTIMSCRHWVNVAETLDEALAAEDLEPIDFSEQ